MDLLIGPYSSGLTLAVAPLAEAHGKILWNHGGASDAIFQGSWRHLVSVPSPASDYLKALPLLVRSQDPPGWPTPWRRRPSTEGSGWTG